MRRFGGSRPPVEQGGRIRYPSVLRTEMNQQDIRILLDPTLGDGVEDLDAPKRPEPKNK